MCYRVDFLLRFSPATGHREKFHFATGYCSGDEDVLVILRNDLIYGISVPLPLLVQMMLWLLFHAPAHFPVQDPTSGTGFVYISNAAIHGTAAGTGSSYSC